MNKTPVRLVTASREAPRGWVVLRPGACPCCVGRVQLQVELARVIREQQPSGVQIEMRNPEHLPGMRRVLAERPLADFLEI